MGKPASSVIRRIICWVHGAYSSFRVEIDPKATICHLKTAIVRVKRNTFRGIDSEDLKVYAANIASTKPAREAFSCQDDEELDGTEKTEKINEHFLKDSPPKTIHFAIKVPGKQHSFVLSTHIC
jgi:hypothetical protein